MTVSQFRNHIDDYCAVMVKAGLNSPDDHHKASTFTKGLKEKWRNTMASKALI